VQADGYRCAQVWGGGVSVYYSDDAITLHHGDSLNVARTLASGSVDCIVTSPPYYGLRNYGSP
jgi:DNA modification methylase